MRDERREPFRGPQKRGAGPPKRSALRGAGSPKRGALRGAHGAGGGYGRGGRGGRYGRRHRTPASRRPAPESTRVHQGHPPCSRYRLCAMRLADLPDKNKADMRIPHMSALFRSRAVTCRGARRSAWPPCGRSSACRRRSGPCGSRPKRCSHSCRRRRDPGSIRGCSPP